MTKMPRPKSQAAPRPIKLCMQPQPVPIVLPESLAPDRARAIRSIKRKWVNGTVLQYHFLESDKWTWPKAQKDVVHWAFDAWKAIKIGLVFEETNDVSEAEIRIGALQTDGSWSFVGTDCLQYQDLGRTMNFGWDLTTEWGHATALHEIGHALGLPHEHQNPNAGIMWNETLVYQVFSGDPNNWDRDMIRHNIIDKLPRWTPSPASNAISCSIPWRRANTRSKPWGRPIAKSWCSRSGTERPGIWPAGTIREKKGMPPSRPRWSRAAATSFACGSIT